MSHGGYDYGLEDKILRKNIPGRYGTWEVDDTHEAGRMAKDNDEDNLRGDHSEFDELRTTPQNRVDNAPTHHHHAGSGKAGAKGVVSDYREHLAHEQQEFARLREAEENAYRRAAYGAIASPPESKPAGEDYDESDAAARALHRRRRVEEMKEASQTPLFGEIREVSAIEMLDAVDNEDSRVCVVVHIYSLHVPACATLNTYLESIARSFPRVKFLRMLSTEAPGGPGAFDADTLPVLVAYRGKDLVASIVKVTDYFGGSSSTSTLVSGGRRTRASFNVDDVEWLLADQGLLDSPASGAPTAAPGPHRASNQREDRLASQRSAHPGGTRELAEVGDSGSSESEEESDNDLGVD